jgi:hypothetical protein
MNNRLPSFLAALYVAAQQKRGSYETTMASIRASVPHLLRDERKLVLGLLLLAALLRLWAIGDKPLWNDEALSLWFSDRSYAFLWAESGRVETHPPLYYTLLKAWRSVFGSSNAALRFPSALASIATVAAIYAAGRAIGGAGSRGLHYALVAGLLAALWRMQIEFAQEARAYAFWSLGVSLILAGALPVLMRPLEAGRPLPHLARRAPALLGAYAMLAAGMAMSMWSHNLGTISVAVAGGSLIVWWAMMTGRNRGLFINLAVTALVATALYAPNVPTLLMQMQKVSSGFWLEAPEPGPLIWLFIRVLSQPAPISLNIRIAAPLLAIVLAIGLFGLWRVSRLGGGRDHAPALFVAAMLGGPLMIMVALTYLVQPVLLPRTLIMLQPPTLLLMAGLPWAMPAGVRRLFALLLFLGTAFGVSRPVALNLEFGRPYPEILEHILSSDSPDAPVLSVGTAAVPLYYQAARSGRMLEVILVRQLFDLSKGETFRSDNVVVLTEEEMMAAIGAREMFWYMARTPLYHDPEGRIPAILEQEGYCETVIIPYVSVDAGFSRYDRAESCEPSQ